MKIARYLAPALLFALTSGAVAQEAAAPTPATVAPAATTASADTQAYENLLGQLRQASEMTALNLAKLRIEKWKTDSAMKKQSQENSDSLQRNLTQAVPDLIAKAKAAPQDFGASFRLYRNLNALYDVLAAVTESAGAFGPKDQYPPLAQNVGELDNIRRSLADRLDWLGGVKDAEIAQLRQQVAQQAAALQAAKEPPKKVVVDDNAPTPKAKKKKAVHSKKPASKPAAQATPKQ